MSAGTSKRQKALTQTQVVANAEPVRSRAAKPSEAVATLPGSGAVVDQQWEEMSELRKAAMVPCYEWSVAYHEAGHVVVMAALGVVIEDAGVCSFPGLGGYACTRWAAEWDHAVVAIVMAAGAQAEVIFANTPGHSRAVTSRDVRQWELHRWPGDGWWMDAIAADLGDVREVLRLVRSVARKILVAHDATLRTVAAVLHERQWVGGKDLARLTASVTWYAATETPR